KAYIFPAEGVSTSQFESWAKLLNDNEAIQFIPQDEKQARSDVSSGRVDVAIKVMSDNYQLIASIDNPNVQLVEQYVHRVFLDELQLRIATQYSEDKETFREATIQYLQNPPLTVQLTDPEGKSLVQYDMNVQLLFTFSLFLSIFTIGYKINSITVEKVSGIWSRVILSPVRKIEMYMGHLLYSFIIGF